MIRPTAFSFNPETADSNVFQKAKGDHEWAQKVGKEFNGVVEVLQNNHIPVYVFDDTIQQSPDALFPNNWLSHMPDGTVTIFPMEAANRRKEVRPDLIDWLMDKSSSTQLIDLRPSIENNQFLEGTGSIVFDYSNRVAFASLSSRTSISLFESYCGEIDYEAISFQSLDLYGRPVYHTNVMMALAESYAIVNLESIENSLERLMLQKKIVQLGKEIITINHAQMMSFCGNVMELKNREGQSFLVMSSRAKKAFHLKQLQKMEQYSQFIEADVSTIEEIGGGGVRCMLAGLFVV